MSQRVGWSGLVIWVDHFVSNPWSRRLVGPPVRHSSNNFSLFVEMKTTKSDPQGRRPFSWSVAAGSKARLSAHLGVFSSQRQANVLCTVNLCGTCSAVCMRGSDVAFKNKAMQYLCLAPLVVVIFRISPHDSAFFHVLTVYYQKRNDAAARHRESADAC